MQTNPDAVSETVNHIAQALGETERPAQALIMRIVYRIGIAAARDYLQKTLEIEQQGGLMLSDGSRRRTPGGVFFHLVKTSLSPKDRVIFWHSQPGPDTLRWEDRLTILKEWREERGEVTTVKITLVGRPGKLIEQPQVVITLMQSTKVPPLPKGLPTPPNVPTLYTVYIARKQWNKVAEAIKNPEDILIIEGWETFDQQVKGIAVFALSVTTKVLQAAKREAQRQAQETG